LYALDYQHKQGASNDLYKQIEQLAQEKKEEGVSLSEALKNIDAAIQGWELDKQSCRDTGNKQGLDEANRQLKNLYAAREQVVEQSKHAEKEQNELRRTMSLHLKIMNDWFTMPFERRKLYTNLIVESVTMQEVAPHILKLILTFKPPIVGTITGYVLRENCGQHTWADAENDAIRTWYTTADRAYILQAIPNRKWMAIRVQAKELGIPRATWQNTSAIPAHLSYADWQRIADIQKVCTDFSTENGSGDVCYASWEPFSSVLLNPNIHQYPLHHQPGEYSPPGMMD